MASGASGDGARHALSQQGTCWHCHFSHMSVPSRKCLDAPILTCSASSRWAPTPPPRPSWHGHCQSSHMCRPLCMPQCSPASRRPPGASASTPPPRACLPSRARAGTDGTWRGIERRFKTGSGMILGLRTRVETASTLWMPAQILQGAERTSQHEPCTFHLNLSGNLLH